MSDLSFLSDGDLDAGYAAAFDAGNAAEANVYSQEILGRLQNVTSFVMGSLGFVRFPLYNARGTFKQVDVAQSAVTQSTQKIIDVGFHIGTIITILVAAVILFELESLK